MNPLRVPTNAGPKLEVPPYEEHTTKEQNAQSNDDNRAFPEAGMECRILIHPTRQWHMSSMTEKRTVNKNELDRSGSCG